MNENLRVRIAPTNANEYQNREESMNCFSHPDIAAVGICKTCSRAICRECVQESEFHITCSTSCAHDAVESHKMAQMGKRIYGIGVKKRPLPMVSVMMIGFSVLFLGWAALLFFTQGNIDAFLVGFSGLCLLIAWLGYKRAKDMGVSC